MAEPLPIVSSPDWGVPQGTGMGLEVDEEKVRRYHDLYKHMGQFLPYDPGPSARGRNE